MSINESFFLESATDTSLSKSDNHYHENYEIYYLSKGQCWYLIGNHSYRITAGSLVLIPPGIIHGTGYLTATHSRIVFYCNKHYIPASIQNKFAELPHFFGIPTTQKKIEHILATIEKEYRTPDEFSSDIIRNKVAELLLLCFRESRDIKQPPVESTLAGKVVQYITEQYHSNATLAQAAAACYVSKEHLSRTFKRETGMNFSEYLILYRLKTANSLLRDHPELRVVDVATRCGFNDSNYFSKVYKKKFGISPCKQKKEP